MKVSRLCITEKNLEIVNAHPNLGFTKSVTMVSVLQVHFGAKICYWNFTANDMGSRVWFWHDEKSEPHRQIILAVLIKFIDSWIVLCRHGIAHASTSEQAEGATFSVATDLVCLSKKRNRVKSRNQFLSLPCRPLEFPLSKESGNSK